MIRRLILPVKYAERYRHGRDWVTSLRDNAQRESRDPFPLTKVGNRLYVVFDAAEEWMRRHFPGQADRINREIDVFIFTEGERPKSGHNTAADDADAGGDTSLPIPTSVEELHELARAGKLSSSQLKLADDALRVIKRARDVEKQGGCLLDAEEVAEVWRGQLMRFRVACENLPARVSARALAEGGIEPRAARALRVLIEEEVRICFETLTTLEDEEDASARAALGEISDEPSGSGEIDPEEAADAD